MNKSKAKNIALGVSVGLNILLGMVFTLSMVKACNAPKTQENASSGVSPRTLGEIPTLANNEPLNAVSTLQTGVEYVFDETINIPQNLAGVYSFNYSTSDGATYTTMAIVVGGGGSDRYYGKKCLGVSTGGVLQFGAASNGDYYSGVTNTWSSDEIRYITFSTLPTNSDFSTWLASVLTLVDNEEPETSSEPEITSSSESAPVGSYEVGEHIGLSADYDFRRWFGNVDPNVGVIGNSYDAVTSVVYGGLEWVAGDGLTYNAISFILQPLQASNAFIVSSDYTAKTAESIYGSDYTKYAMLTGIYYLYIDGYDGAPIYDAIGTNYPTYEYRSRVYYMPLVAGTLDGTNNGVNAIDLRGFAIDKVYRSFDVVSDGGNRFNTIAYDNTTLSTMLKNNFTTIVSFGDVTTNPFTLLSSAFSSVGAILSIAILPNLTLGTLIFIPLVVTIILVIVRLLQK